MNVDVGGKEDNMMVGPDLNGLEFVGAYMADLNNDDTVWMAAISDLSEFNTKLVVVVENANKNKLESKFVNPATQTDHDDRCIQDNIWMDGNLVLIGW